jgi:hypothetical protein
MDGLPGRPPQRLTKPDLNDTTQSPVASDPTRLVAPPVRPQTPGQQVITITGSDDQLHRNAQRCPLAHRKRENKRRGLLHYIDAFLVVTNPLSIINGESSRSVAIAPPVRPTGARISGTKP